jgi:Resolvase, N terminal domain
MVDAACRSEFGTIILPTRLDGAVASRRSRGGLSGNGKRREDRPCPLAPRSRQLEKGDVLTVTRLDRLAPSTRDLLNTLAAITGKGAGFC